jgi:hypothetical protein
MLRRELILGAQQLNDALEKSGVLRVIPRVGRQPTNDAKEQNAPIFNAFRRYSLSSADFSYAARTIKHIMGLDPLDDPSFWASLSKESKEMYDVYQAMTFTQRYLPLIIGMLQQETIAEMSPLLSVGIGQSPGKLTVILPEPPGTVSRPQRLIDALSSISLLYEAFADLERAPRSDLSVIACDAGSDKSFDFLGLANLMKAVKELLLSVWDRVVFFREQQVAQRLDLIASSLPIIDKLGDLQRENKLGPEECELIRRKIVEGVTKFLTSGSAIPEMGERSNFDPYLLMAPEPKLLTTNSEKDTDASNPEDSPVEKERQEFLDRLRGTTGDMNNGDGE